mgnify:CR=1 FL=1
MAPLLGWQQFLFILLVVLVGGAWGLGGVIAVGIAAELAARTGRFWLYRKPVNPVINVIVVFGLVAYNSLGVDLFPKVDFPVVTVTTILPGADPETIETDVTERLEVSKEDLKAGWGGPKFKIFDLAGQLQAQGIQPAHEHVVIRPEVVVLVG